MTKSKEKKRSQKTVLVIDDDPQVRDLLQMVLCGSGYQVRIAKQSAEGTKARAHGERISRGRRGASGPSRSSRPWESGGGS